MIQIILSSIFALTFNLSAFAAPPALQGEPYLNSCEGFLDAVRGDAVERFFLRQVKNDRQLTQLLIDYRVLFTPEFDAAVMLAIEQRNLTPRSKALYHYARALGEVNPILAGTVYRRKRTIIRDVLENLRQTSAKDSDADVARVAHKRINALISAALASDHRAAFERLVGLAIRAHLLAAVKGRTIYSMELPNVWIARMGGGTYGFFLGAIFLGRFFLPDHPGMMTLVSLATAAGAGALSEQLDRAYFRRLYGQAIPRHQLTFRGAPVSVGAVDAHGYGVVTAAVPALVSLTDARAIDLEAMSPVDLAYLGHLEMLGLGASPLAQISGQNLGEVIELVRERAAVVKDDVQSARVRIQFAAAINDLRAFIGTLPKGNEPTVVATERRAEKIAADVAALERKLYANHSNDLTEPNLLKLEIIAEKLNGDLIQVSRVRVDRERVRQVFEILDPVARRLGAILETIPREDAQWISAADEALVAIDELTLGLTK